MKEITDEDLVLYIYNEAPPVLKALIEKELMRPKGEVKKRFLTIKETLEQLNQLKLPSPSLSSIEKILQKTGLKSSDNRKGK